MTHSVSFVPSTQYSPHAVRDIDGTVIIFEKTVRPPSSANAATPAAVTKTSNIVTAAAAFAKNAAAIAAGTLITDAEMPMHRASLGQTTDQLLTIDTGNGHSPTSVPAQPYASSPTATAAASVAAVGSAARQLLVTPPRAANNRPEPMQLEGNGNEPASPEKAALTVPVSPVAAQLELLTCEDYFRDLLYRVEVTFCDKTEPSDVGFTLELSLRMTYDQMATAVSRKINCEPRKIQFFKCQK